MGTVYRGERLSVGRPVAIKFLNPAVAALAVFVEQFRNEVPALSSRVCHPNCASMIHFGVEGPPSVGVDLLGGVTLRQTLEEERRILEVRPSDLVDPDDGAG